MGQPEVRLTILYQPDEKSNQFRKRSLIHPHLLCYESYNQFSGVSKLRDQILEGLVNKGNRVAETIHLYTLYFKGVSWASPKPTR